ncbi:MAG: ATP-binding protein [Oscillospiraceae bacterium]|nr:ATP-binding protein [Oscillospiraceae bacterium]
MFHDLHDRLDELVIFQSLYRDDLFRTFRRVIGMVGETGIDWWVAKTEYYRFVRLLYARHTTNWTVYLRDLVLSTETPLDWYLANDVPIPRTMMDSAKRELGYLSRTASISSAMIKQYHINMGCGEFTGVQGLQPDWHAYEANLEPLFWKRMKDYKKQGSGMYARHHMFHMKRDADLDAGYVLQPARFPDPIRIGDLIGYEMQRQQVIDNTRALLAGKKASNILLYGDAGTGKSATVKAIANEFADEGLRLIELSKDELHLLPGLLDELSENPLKFILFIDDLSFQENDDDFSALKAVLEGSISARSQNTVIYATSNRRHIVRETFSQREGDEIHRNDTMQETISLSERFGIRILFDKPNKDLYLNIVRGLAEQSGLEMDEEQLAQEAERFALRKSGRSARAARQLIEQLSAKQDGAL